MDVNAFGRAALREAFRGRTIRRRLPMSAGGALVHVAPESQLKYLLPGTAGLDRSLLGWAERYVRPGDIVWDIGANSGVFAMAAAGLGASVLAVEPDPFLANALLRTRAANPTLRMEVLAAAIDEKCGTATLEIAGGGRAANALSVYAGGRAQFGKSRGRVIVPTLSLDDLLSISIPDLIKIDIEGAELAALRGASAILSRVRPRMIIEIASEEWAIAADIFCAARYQLCDPDDPGKIASKPLFNVMARPT
jgi:FkbM family methyltransferase